MCSVGIGDKGGHENDLGWEEALRPLGRAPTLRLHSQHLKTVLALHMYFFMVVYTRCALRHRGL